MIDPAEYMLGAFNCQDCHVRITMALSAAVVTATVRHEPGCPWLVRARGVPQAGPAVLVVHRQNEDTTADQNLEGEV